MGGGGPDLPRRDQRVAEKARTEHSTPDSSRPAPGTWRASRACRRCRHHSDHQRGARRAGDHERARRRAVAGLQQAGVTGLVLLPEALRHPFGFGRPCSLPATSLPRPSSRRPPRRPSRAARAGGHAGLPCPRGAVAGRARRDGRRPRVVVRAGGGAPGREHRHRRVMLFPKVNALVVNPRALGALTDAHGGSRATRPRTRCASRCGRRCRTRRRRTSTATTAAPSSRRPPTTSARSGGQRSAPAPRSTGFADPEADRPDPGTQGASAAEAPPAIALCRPPAGTERPAPPPAPRCRPGEVPDGVYREEVTEQELLATGIGERRPSATPASRRSPSSTATGETTRGTRRTSSPAKEPSGLRRDGHLRRRLRRPAMGVFRQADVAGLEGGDLDFTALKRANAFTHSSGSSGRGGRSAEGISERDLHVMRVPRAGGLRAAACRRAPRRGRRAGAGPGPPRARRRRRRRQRCGRSDGRRPMRSPRSRETPTRAWRHWRALPHRRNRARPHLRWDFSAVTDTSTGMALWAASDASAPARPSWPSTRGCRPRGQLAEAPERPREPVLSEREPLRRLRPDVAPARPSMRRGQLAQAPFSALAQLTLETAALIVSGLDEPTARRTQFGRLGEHLGL